jgi:hypothetical protein
MPFAQSFDKSQVSFLFLPRYRSWAARGRARTKEGAANALFAKRETGWSDIYKSLPSRRGSY